MSTAQDHKALASLQDVFGPGAGSSGYNFNSGVATFSSTGAAGSSGGEGSAGDVGKTILGLGNVGMSIVSGKKLNTANQGLVNAMNNPTIEGLTSAIEKGKEAQSTFGVARTVADVDKYSRMATGAGDLLTTGDAGTLGSNVVDVASTYTGGIVPALGAVESLLPGPNPIATTTDYFTKKLNELPGASKANEVLGSFGKFMQELPGAAPTGRILSAVGDIPSNILGDIPAGIIGSFKNKDKYEASDRDAALTHLFTQEDAEGNSQLKAPSGHALGETPTHVAFPGGSYNFPYQGAGGNELTLADLYEEFLASDTGQTLGGQTLQTLIDVEEKDPTSPTPPLYGPPAPPVIKDEDYPLPDIPNFPLGSPASTTDFPLVERQEVARTGLDQYPPLPTQTQRHDPSLPNYKKMPPLNYWTFPQYPILEPIPLEAPAADPYQAPKKASDADVLNPVETAPTVRSDLLNPLKRVRPEELVTPRTAPSGPSRHEQDLANYIIAVEKESARKNKNKLFAGQPVFRTNDSKARAADLLGFNAPLRTASQYMDLDARTKPKHNLRELTTGRNASSY